MQDVWRTAASILLHQFFHRLRQQMSSAWTQQHDYFSQSAALLSSWQGCSAFPAPGLLIPQAFPTGKHSHSWRRGQTRGSQEGQILCTNVEN